MARGKRKRNILNSEIFGIIIIIFSILFFMSLFSYKVGIVGLFIKSSFFPLMGFGAYLFPILTFIFGIHLFLNKNSLIKLKKYIYIMAMFLLFLIVLDSNYMTAESLLPRLKNAISLSKGHRGGGIIGAFLGYFYYSIFGLLGGSILLFLLFGIFIILSFEINIKEEFIKLIRKIKDKRKKKANIEDLIYPKVKENLEETEEINPSNLPSIKEEIDKKIKLEKEEEEDLSSALIKKKLSTYKAPPISLLQSEDNSINHDFKKELRKNAQLIEDTMSNFGIDAKITQINKGPTITCYELTPSPGIKLSKIVSLSDNIAMSLASSDIRIEAPIPGKSAVGIEVPNKIKENVYLKEIIKSKEYKEIDSAIPLALGKDVTGKIIVSSIDKMPHLLIAGATGSGKSVCINSIIMNIIYKSKPDDVRLILIDPKVVELSIYNHLPHLLIPVVTDAKKASSALNWAVSEMEDRYKLFAGNNVRDIEAYNKKQIEENLDKLAKIVIIIDELSDLMMVSPQEVEDHISRLAQMARAAGIHLIVATQRPSVDVITGTIKANIPSRISFAVSSQVDSRTILDMSGAEKLLGEGDMLFYPSFYSKPQRIQASYISPKEIEKVVGYLKTSYENGYEEDIIEALDKKMSKDISSQDELLFDAIELILSEEQASISFLQRKLRIGYARAARLIDEMEDMGIIGGFEGSKPRKILINKEDFEKILSSDK